MKRVHFAGINTRPLATAAKGQDVLVSYADFAKPGGASLWAWMRPLIEGGHFRQVILDSGAFTELKEKVKLRKLFAAGKLTQAQLDERTANVFKVDVDAYAAFAAEHQHLFTWVANLDDIEGDIETSNSNFSRIRAAGVDNVVPVFHEGESMDQLARCIEWAREGRRMLAVGCQRPMGSLRPRKVVAFLKDLFAHLADAGVDDIEFHGFGLTRYAGEACPCNGPAEGFPFESTDSTTWIAEGCAVERSGAMGRGIQARHAAFHVTITSYQGVRYAAGHIGRYNTFPVSVVNFDSAAAVAAGGQAKTVAQRLQEVTS